MKGKDPSEKLANTYDVLLDHRGIVALGVTIGLLGMCMKADPGNVGASVMNESRRREVEKWGRRVI